MSDFWSRRLGGNSPPAHFPGTPHAPPPGLPSLPLGSTQTSHPKALSSLSTARCPECGSGNYTGSPSDRTKMIRCYDCGHNPRFGQQAGAAGIPAGQSAPTQAARQVSTQNNYQPMTVIGRIS